MENQAQIHELTQKEIQGYCMGMLRLVDHICKKEHLTYFLSGGTLLGAIRHQGFIPWDDDVDLMMPRPDYEEFLKAAPKYLGRRYLLMHPDRDKEYAKPWARICDTHTHLRPSRMQKYSSANLFLDIFPIEGLPTHPLFCKLFYKKIRAYDIMLKCSRRKGLYEDERLRSLKRVLIPISNIRKSNAWAKSLDHAARHRSFYNAHYAGVCLVTHYGERERMPAEVFRGSVKVTFEGETYPAPVGWDTYLKRLYGNYMQLPPESARCTTHNMHATADPEEAS